MLKESSLFPCVTKQNALSLNPYFNGTCSKSGFQNENIGPCAYGLNPYFNGTCSKSNGVGTGKTSQQRSLNPYFNGTCSKRAAEFLMEKGYFLTVLILILMEHAQRVIETLDKHVDAASLNPYFNGTCSKSTIMKLSEFMKKS